MRNLLIIISILLAISGKGQTDDKEKTRVNSSISSKHKKLQTFFEDLNIQGSITIYDYKNKKWILSDKQDSKRRTLPASTFKIPNSLISIEEKILKDEKEVLGWGGKITCYG